MLKLEMLPVAQGDALWIEYGSPDKIKRIIVDGGPYHRYNVMRERIKALPKEKRRFELLIITHIDCDHIDGIIRLLQDKTLGVCFDDIWFNGWRHVSSEEPDRLGSIHGEFLGALLDREHLPWNKAFKGKAVVIEQALSLPRLRLPGGMEIVLLSPDRPHLEKLKQEWDTTLRKNGFTPGNSQKVLEELEKRSRYAPPEDKLGKETDDSPANGSSIAFLARYGDRSLLLTGDAFRDVLVEGILRYIKEEKTTRLVVDDFKLPHHGSASNLSYDLLTLVDAKRYLFSTNGAIHGHPDASTIELICKHPGVDMPFLVFNYLSETTRRWQHTATQKKFGYQAFFPET